MKLHHTDLPIGKKQIVQKTSNIVFLLGLVLFLTIFLLLLIRSSSQPWSSFLSSSAASPPFSVAGDLTTVRVDRKCNIFSGEWIPNPGAPYYTNDTCSAIYDHQNCIKYGRPDADFMKWKWKPDDCELPIFDPPHFLELVRGKSLAFVGDSVARNQMQSLICLLSKVEHPVDISYSKDEQSRRWKYANHNFTVANFWSPYLVKANEVGPNFPGLFNLYLDEFDRDWTTKIEEFDFVIISGGHWFFRPTMFYENNQLVGCHYCPQKNVTVLNTYYGYSKAFRTAFRAMNSLKNFKGITYLRTFAPSHFENGLWNEGGDCARIRPFMRNETHLDGEGLELYMTQLEEFKVAEREGVKKGFKFRLIDTTRAMLMRPDGHPSRYGRRADLNWPNDCLHWCLPGPVDTMNDFLLEIMKMEGEV